MKPIRCYTCGKVLGNRWEIIEREMNNGVPLKEIYDKVKVTRYCCKRVIMTSVDDTVKHTERIPENITMNCERKKTVFIKIV